MNKSPQAQTRLDKICYKRLNSSDFAIKPNLIQRITRLISGGTA